MLDLRASLLLNTFDVAPGVLSVSTIEDVMTYAKINGLALKLNEGCLQVGLADNIEIAMEPKNSSEETHPTSNKRLVRDIFLSRFLRAYIRVLLRRVQRGDLIKSLKGFNILIARQ